MEEGGNKDLDKVLKGEYRELKSLVSDFGYNLVTWCSRAITKAQVDQMVDAIERATDELDAKYLLPYLLLKRCDSIEKVSLYLSIVEDAHISKDLVRKRASRAMEKIKKSVEEDLECIIKK